MSGMRLCTAALLVSFAWGCQNDLAGPGEGGGNILQPAGKPTARASYLLDFSGDIQASGVAATADPNDLWRTLKVSGPVTVALPATLSNPDSFHLVNPDPSLDYNAPYDRINFPYCTYSEADPRRINSWGANAGSWGNTEVIVTNGLVSSNGGPELRIDLRSPALKRVPAGTPKLLVAARDSDATFEGNVATFTKGQALVSAGSPDPHTDPCITVTIVATRL